MNWWWLAGLIAVFLFASRNFRTILLIPITWAVAAIASLFGLSSSKGRVRLKYLADQMGIDRRVFAHALARANIFEFDVNVIAQDHEGEEALTRYLVPYLERGLERLNAEHGTQPELTLATAKLNEWKRRTNSD